MRYHYGIDGARYRGLANAVMSYLARFFLDSSGQLCSTIFYFFCLIILACRLWRRGFFFLTPIQKRERA